MNVKLVSITAPLINGIESAEELIAYCARVSNPSNQLNSETAPRLLKYCIKHAHWSIFEMADMCVEIKTSRAIAAQILRHKSFSFQEFSQRYSNIASIEDIELRKQAESNRQSSSDVISDPILKNVVNLCLDHAVQTYHKLIIQE
jgi:thymidylate synthase (FAD)